MPRSDHKERSSVLPTPAGPRLPRADQPKPAFGGFGFDAAEPPADVAGVFVFTRRIGDFLYPVLVGAADDLTRVIAELRGEDPVLAREADGLYWMRRPDLRQRAHIARELIGKFDPPLNVEHRKSRSAPELAAMVPDRAGSGAVTGEALHLAADVVVSEDELNRLVEEFYVLARADSLIGPVFSRAVADWDAHRKIVQDFWSRTLLGTTRYKGNPFGPHRSLDLQPEFFDRWIELFKTVAIKVLQPAAAQRAVAKVEHMSVCFQAGLFLPAVPDHEGTGARQGGNAHPL